MGERLSRLEQMAQKLQKGSGNEAREVDERKAEINELWDKLKVLMTFPSIVITSLLLLV